jgi:hypothetical protein
MTTFESLTSARAIDSNERSPCDRFAPSLSTLLSSVKRRASGPSPTRYARRSASQSAASSYSPNGSRFERIVPLNSSGSCGMIEIRERRSRSPRVEMSILRP